MRDLQERDGPSALSPIETVLVWGVRQWVSAHKAKESGHEAIEAQFESHGVRDAAASLDAILRMTAACATRSIDVRCPCCPGLSDDEMRIVAAIGLMQWNEPTIAFELFSTWLPPTGVRMALHMAHGAAIVLARAGHSLPLRRWDFPELEAVSRPTLALLQKALVH